MPTTLDKLLDTISGYINNFSSKLPNIEKDIVDKLLEQIKDLDTKGGTISSSIGNIRKLSKITSSLKNILISKEYKNLIKDLVPVFNEITSLQNQYFKEQEVSYTASKISELIKNQSILDTVNGLTEAGIGGIIQKEITEVLKSNIATGGSYKQLTKQLRDMMTTNETPGILSRYAGQIVTDSVNQFSATHLQTISADLGYSWYRYQGKDIATTRTFCDCMTDKSFFHVAEVPYLLEAKDAITGETLKAYNEKKKVEETVKLNPRTGLPNGMIAGTTAENFLVRRGGYNCGHQIFPVPELIVPQAVKDAFYTKFPEYKKQAPKPAAAEQEARVGTISEQIVALYKAGKTNAEIVAMGYNASTVNVQVNKYKKSLTGAVESPKKVVSLPKAPKEHNFSDYDYVVKNTMQNRYSERLVEETKKYNKVTGQSVTPEQFINLAGGIIGKDMHNISLSLSVYDKEETQINIDNNKYNFTRIVNWKEKSIYNEFFRVNKGFQGEGLGTKILYTEAREAQRQGFKYIKCDAYRRPLGDDSFNGYYTWPKLGYQMFNPEDKRKFGDLMKGWPQRQGVNGGKKIKVPASLSKVKDLTELISTPEGSAFWKEHGFRFDAKFDLTEGSESWIILNSIVNKKYGQE